MKDGIVYKVSTHVPTRELLKIHDKMYSLVTAHSPKSVLEIGSGTGILGSRIEGSAIRYMGIEPDEEQHRLCRESFPHLEVRKASCYEDPERLGLGRFDMVISNDVVEHLYLPSELVRFKKAHLNPGGIAITATPNFGSYFKNLAYSIFNRWDQVHSPWWDGGHIKFFSKRSLRLLFENEGFGNFSWSHVRNINYPIFVMTIICTCSLTGKSG
jgi:SAM-dependent methyltransferase